MSLRRPGVQNAIETPEAKGSLTLKLRVLKVGEPTFTIQG
jgi:hypothetical protein